MSIILLIFVVTYIIIYKQANVNKHIKHKK